MIFDYKFIIDLKKIEKHLNLNKIKILDYGCGLGIWDESQIAINNKVRRIIMFDSNKSILKTLKRKYKNKKFDINFNLKSILKKKEYNVIVISSVIQYLSKQDLEKLIKKLSHGKKKIVIMIIDIPYISRIFEFILLPFFNIRRFIFSVRLLLSKKYISSKFYVYSKNYFLNYKNKYEISFRTNLHDLKMLRYSLIMKSKN